MTVLNIFLGPLLNSLFNNLKKTLQNLEQQGRKTVSKFELSETQFEKTARNEIACKTHLEWENDCYKHILGSLLNFLFNNLNKHYKIWNSKGENGVKVWSARNTVWKDSQVHNRL